MTVRVLVTGAAGLLGTELVRLARQRVRPEVDNPFRDRLHFALEIEVKAGRMAHVGLGHVGLEPETAGEVKTLAEAQWPRELTAYATCLAPHLLAVAMSPSPADGSYEPVYSFGGRTAGRHGP